MKAVRAVDLKIGSVILEYDAHDKLFEFARVKTLEYCGRYKIHVNRMYCYDRTATVYIK